jgi:hypothetical protein
MLTKARLDKDVKPAELDWITALRAPQIKALVESGALQLSLFDEQNLLEITHPDYPGERLMCCRNPILAEERATKREALLKATEAELDKILAATTRSRQRLSGKDAIALRVGRVINSRKVGKHFIVEIGEDSLSWRRDEAKIAAEAALDGIYVIRTSLPASSLGAEEVVLSYKGLEDVERFFRGVNSELDIRPIHHRLADRVRAHVLLAMLSYYVSWHMKQKLAPVLFYDDDKDAAKAKRCDVVAPALRSDQALKKAARKTTANGETVQSFIGLLRDLGTVCANHVRPTDTDAAGFVMVTTPTPSQRRAFELLGVSHRLGYS